MCRAEIRSTLQDIERIHESQDCSELAKIAHDTLDMGRIVTIKSVHPYRYLKYLVNKDSWIPFAYHTFLYVDRHIFDPDTEQKYIPSKQYLYHFLLENDIKSLSELVINNSGLRRIAKKILTSRSYIVASIEKHKVDINVKEF